jgi:hypothetical protein
MKHRDLSRLRTPRPLDAGERALLAGAYGRLRTASPEDFPKTCGTCGAVYRNFDEFIRNTESPGTASGLGEFPGAKKAPAQVGVFRNCRCRSTLMVLCRDRRDETPGGLERRRLFNDLLKFLVDHGVSRATARAELQRVARGGDSDLLNRMMQGGDAGAAAE